MWAWWACDELLWFPLLAGVEETVSDSEAQQTLVA